MIYDIVLRDLTRKTKIVHEFRGHTKYINSIISLSEGFLSCSDNGTNKVKNSSSDNRQSYHTFQGHAGGVICLNNSTIKVVQPKQRHNQDEKDDDKDEYFLLGSEDCTIKV